ncbi:MAG TPA: (d)CMP kinase [Clostridia bacterium]|nr:(d)CMP kinase [Clostridia bacterium]
MRPNIAIDGPAGAGKSTVAKKLSQDLGYLYIDTGAMYRAVAYYALKEGIDLKSEKALADLVRNLDISLAYDQENQLKVYCNGTDITDKLRTQIVSQNVSIVARVPAVRLRLVENQRKMAAKGGVVMDGRDIGSFVLPDAQLKLFITASLEQRTIRRMKELQAQGYRIDFEELKQEIKQRDTIDALRKMAPLKKAQDAITVDTTNLTVDETVQHILNIYKERFGCQ